MKKPPLKDEGSLNVFTTNQKRANYKNALCSIFQTCLPGGRSGRDTN